MLHRRFEKFYPREDSIAHAEKKIKGLGQAFGLALDDSLKTLAMWIGFRPGGMYDPFDLEMGDLLVEFKSTAEKTFTFSKQEHELILNRIRNDQQYICLFYLNNLADKSSLFLGQLTLDHLSKMNFIPSKFKHGEVYLALDEVSKVLDEKYSTPQL